MTPSLNAREALIAGLRREVERLEVSRPLTDDQPVSTGSLFLDNLLPANGLRRGTLVDYLAEAAGSGAGVLALGAASEACRDGRALVVVESRQFAPRVVMSTHRASGPLFYPPAATAWGIDLSALLVLRVANEADAVWALDQALRCPGVGAVWARCDRFHDRDFRRLQLAAESGGTLGLFIRPARYRGQPTWADVQFQVSPKSNIQSPKSKTQSPTSSLAATRLSPFAFRLSAWQLGVEVVRCRGGAGGQKVLLEFDEAERIWREVDHEATHFVPALARLADPTPARRA
jgi:hypothetical protein